MKVEERENSVTAERGTSRRSIYKQASATVKREGIIEVDFIFFSPQIIKLFAQLGCTDIVFLMAGLFQGGARSSRVRNA